jgi:hypothetical protein
MVSAVADNDILFKGAAYRLLTEFLSAIPCSANELAILGASHFVVKSKLKNTGISMPEEKIVVLESFLGIFVTLEPNEEEINFAANLELFAQWRGLNLDSGESQLCAIVLRRGIDRLVTGDKRAIKALGSLLSERADLAGLVGRLICLEQLFLRLLSTDDTAARVRRLVCAERRIDKTIDICFACHRESSSYSEWREGLNSYISELRSAASALLSE